MHALIYYPLLTTTIYLLTTLALLLLHLTLPHIPILGFAFRCLAAYLSLIICALYGTLASLVLRCFGLHYKYAQYSTARSFKFICRATMGVEFHILDDGRAILSSKRPFVIVGNHQTELDVLLLGSVFPPHCSVSAKKSLKYVPFLGWFMALSGTVFIDRFDRSRAMKAFEGAATVMREVGQSVFIFPEGTRSYARGPTMLPFKKGAFHLAVQAGVDVVPVVAENYSKILDVKARRFESGTIRVRGMFSVRLVEKVVRLCFADEMG